MDSEINLGPLASRWPGSLRLDTTARETGRKGRLGLGAKAGVGALCWREGRSEGMGVLRGPCPVATGPRSPFLHPFGLFRFLLHLWSARRFVPTGCQALDGQLLPRVSIMV